MARTYLNTAKYSKAYEKGDIVIPYTDNPDHKSGDEGKLYFLRWAEYIWANYVTNRTLIPFGAVTSAGKSFETLRAYGLGKQSKAQYAQLLDEADPNTNEGLLNINWDNVQILPKFRDIVKGKMIGADMEIVTNAIDENSKKERLLQVNKMKLLTHPLIQQTINITGVKPQGVKIPEGINNVQDLETLNKMGGIRLEREIMIKDCIEWTKYNSKYDNLIGEIAEDIIDFNIGATRTYIERPTGLVKVDRVSPMGLVCRASTYQDHRDIDFAGEIKNKSISQLRMETDLDEQALWKIAKEYMSTNRNPATNIGEMPDINFQRTYGDKYSGSSTGKFPYDNFSVDVLEFYFIGNEVEKYIIGSHDRDGNMIYDQVNYDSQLDERDIRRGKKMEKKVIQYVYKAQWIIGTQVVFNCGKEYGVVRQGHNGIKKAILPIQIYSDKSPSITERCIPYVDDIQLATLKKRNVLSKMAPGPRMIFDKSVLRDSVSIGGQEYSLLQMLELFPKTGVLIVESKPEFAGIEEGASNKKAVDFMPTGIAEDINILMTDIGASIDGIRQVTAVNEVSDGSTTQQDMLVQVMEGLNAATNNALRPNFKILFGLTENTFQYVAQKWQVSVINGEIDIDYVPIGDGLLRSVKANKDITDADFGITLKVKPSKEERTIMLQQIGRLQENGQLAIEDYYTLWNMITDGDLKKAQLFLAQAANRHRQEIHQRELEKIQAQTEGNAQAAQAAEAAKQQTIQLEHQLQMQLEQMQGQMKSQLSAQEHAQKLKEIEMENTLKQQGAIIDKTLDKAMGEDLPVR